MSVSNDEGLVTIEQLCAKKKILAANAVTLELTMVASAFDRPVVLSEYARRIIATFEHLPIEKQAQVVGYADALASESPDDSQSLADEIAQWDRASEADLARFEYELAEAK